MSRRTNADKGKESLELLGVKVDPALKKAIEDEGDALGIPMSTYARQILIVGWQSRHETSIAKNPREQILVAWFNELPIGDQETVLTMVEALHKKRGQRTTGKLFEVVDNDKAQPREEYRAEDYEDAN